MNKTRGLIGRRVTLDGGKQEWRLEKIVHGGTASHLSHFIRRGKKCGWVERKRLRFVRGKFTVRP